MTATLVMLFSACAHKGGDTGGSAADPLANIDCTVDKSIAVVARLTEVPTVARVEWDGTGSASAYIAFAGPDGSMHLTSSVADGELLLRGLWSQSTWRYRVVTDENPARCSAIASFTTGSVPAELPELAVNARDASGVPDGFIAVPVITEDARYVTVIDTNGRYVWAYHARETVYGAAFAGDRGGLLYNQDAPSADEDGYVVDVGYDGQVRREVAIPSAHTDFVELPDGSMAALGWDIRRFGDRKLLGDTVVEVAPNGDARRVWDAFDTFEPDLSQQYDKGWYRADPDVEDWSHANSISYDPATQSYLLTVSNLDTIVRIDRQTGEVVWTLAGDGQSGDYPVADPPIIDAPHSVFAMPNGDLMVFNRSMADGCSYAARISLDGGTAAITWSYKADPCLFVYFLGQARPLDDGNLQVVWSTSGRIDLVDPGGNALWTLAAAAGAGFGFSDHASSLY